ncbi:triphosphoribosyl-dephospho-CoA synthase [Methylogaea oryzae]|uniref:Triphosphoribosyl-dephospho-CoA synthase n=1 Tax=Methylogaea oryzae TaxID=1295382 RepID=A0A8D4VS39_9GAMM|nr:triphosphoribosyl-dephospho-CoA synthase [Methylogaea oryzae]BBL72279.1 triphosphoribosyl-dephospho-CoA synthase [Methylogaea oryzae]
MSRRDLRQAVQQAYLEACELELQAFKPGNVSVYSEGHGMTVEHFRRSAAASAAPLADPSLSLGEKIREATRATWAVVDCNTNLGILLLCAPLIQAVQQPRGADLRQSLSVVLQNTTREDAEAVYEAIRLASPGGLGEAPQQDVRDAPQVTLLEAMALAAQRDRIAYQYVNGYPDIFDFAIPRYHTSRRPGKDEAWLAVDIFAGLLRRIPDSHIERKYGDRYSRMVAERMALVEESLSKDGPDRCLELLREVDAEFKAVGVNPGTTADLTVAGLLAVRLCALFDNYN